MRDGIAENLRAWAVIDVEMGKYGRAECMEGAADEIERLQKRVRELEAAGQDESR